MELMSDQILVLKTTMKRYPTIRLEAFRLYHQEGWSKLKKLIYLSNPMIIE